MLHPSPLFHPAGDSAIQVEVGDGISIEVNRYVHALDAALRKTGTCGIADIVPAYRSLLVAFDPLVIASSEVKAIVAATWLELKDSGDAAARLVRVPACYGGEFGPDLEFVAAHAGITSREVIEIHSAGIYTVYMMGFSPGFAYLGGLSPRIRTPRLETPRTEIPAGSIGIAQDQTGIYPVASPGGWRLIGRTPITLFNPGTVPPTAVEPGDSMQFVPVDEATYRAIEQEVRAGRYRVERIGQRAGSPCR
ncbi:MAG: 5-oxoprolinase subunit PxpB [Vicinamibacterales bacterium]